MQNSSRRFACSLVDVAKAISSDSRRGEIDDYRRLCTLLRAPANDSIITRGGTANQSPLPLALTSWGADERNLLLEDNEEMKESDEMPEEEA